MYSKLTYVAFLSCAVVILVLYLSFLSFHVCGCTLVYLLVCILICLVLNQYSKHVRAGLYVSAAVRGV